MHDDRVFKALANGVRRQICDALRLRPLTTSQLAESFPELDRCTVMQHVGVLERAGLVVAVRKGRDFGVSPSMTKSSMTKLPRQRCTDSRPMCIGRLRALVPACSARCRSAGPRSTVMLVTRMTAIAQANVATMPRTMRRVLFVRGWW